jgi:dethiobiotin synthetase
VSLFVTGTDTGVGKTHTVVQLLRLLRASGTSCAGFKPICCGDRHDAEVLLAASSQNLTINEINPLWLKTPAAPFAAALVEEININIQALLAAFAVLQQRVDHIFVEGVGGWLVPIRADYFVSDLAMEMKLPVLVVAENRLGCLNHTALTVQSVMDHGLHCAGVVLNNPSDQTDIAVSTNADILRRILEIPILSGLTENADHLAAEWRRVIAPGGDGETSVGIASGKVYTPDA